jgi:hypothetical protein
VRIVLSWLKIACGARPGDEVVIGVDICDESRSVVVNLDSMRNCAIVDVILEVDDGGGGICFCENNVLNDILCLAMI